MTKTPEPDLTTVTGRFSHLFKILFGSNQSAMAEQVGVSQSVISKIVAGDQGPGRRVLSALADHPKVNPSWLVTGEGEPLVTGPDFSAGVPVPVARQPLSGPPNECEDQLTGQMYPIFGVAFDKAGYWLELQRNEPVTKTRSQKLCAGDLLLIVPGKPSTVEDVDRRLCIVRVKEGRTYTPQLAAVTFYRGDPDEPAHLEADLFQCPYDRLEKRYRIVLEGNPGEVPDRVTTEAVRTTTSGTRPVAPSMYASQTLAIQLRDIVGVCRLVVRRTG